MTAKNIKGFYDLLNDEEELELPLAYAYIDEDDACHVALFGDDEDIPTMMLSMLLEYYLDGNEGATVEEYAESIKQELIRFHFEQGTEE